MTTSIIQKMILLNFFVVVVLFFGFSALAILEIEGISVNIKAWSNGLLALLIAHICNISYFVDIERNTYD